MYHLTTTVVREEKDKEKGETVIICNIHFFL